MDFMARVRTERHLLTWRSRCTHFRHMQIEEHQISSSKRYLGEPLSRVNAEEDVISQNKDGGLGFKAAAHWMHGVT